MEASAPFSFEELGAAIHKFTVDIFATTDDGFAKKVAEDGLTREQAAALLMGDAMRVYTRERSATAGESANFILNPDWKYVRQMMSDLLTEIYVEQTPAYEVEASKRNMTLRRFGAGVISPHKRIQHRANLCALRLIVRVHEHKDNGVMIELLRTNIHMGGGTVIPVESVVSKVPSLPRCSLVGHNLGWSLHNLFHLGCRLLRNIAPNVIKVSVQDIHANLKIPVADTILAPPLFPNMGTAPGEGQRGIADQSDLSIPFTCPVLDLCKFVPREVEIVLELCEPLQHFLGNMEGRGFWMERDRAVLASSKELLRFRFRRRLG